jgi:putative transposase
MGWIHGGPKVAASQILEARPGPPAHLLVNEPPSILLAQFVKAVKQVTSRKLRGQREKFWQEGYYDSNVRGDRDRTAVIRYIHRNPVKRGLVEKPEDWLWSSYRHYSTGTKGAVEIESDWTSFQRGNQFPEELRECPEDARSSQRTR